MSNESPFAISAAGMEVEHARVKVAALNLANAHTTAAPGQVAYQPLRVLAHPTQPVSFASLMQAIPSAGAALKPGFSIEPAPVAPRMVLEPGHPMADARGFVTYPGVDTATEMMSMMSASRAYEANIAAFNTAKMMALKALDIGSGS